MAHDDTSGTGDLFPEAPPQPGSVFFAILPDAETATRITALARDLRDEHGLKGEPQVGRFHISLHAVADRADALPRDIAAASEAAAAITTPPFDVALDQVMSFGSRNGELPFVLAGGDGLVALKAFHEALGRAMAWARIGRHVKREANPHVTLLYDRRRVAPEPVGVIQWTVREFALVRSLHGQGRHVVLGRWPLRGTPSPAAG